MVIGAGIIGGLAGGSSVNIVIRAVDMFSKTFALANKKMLLLGGAMTAIGVAGAVAVGGLIKVAGQFEQTQIAFSTMLGSAEEADKLLKELANFAAKTPFTIPGIEQNAKMLLAMSIETDKLLPTLKSLGDVASGLNVPIDRLALNLGQVKVQGKLTGRELRDFAVAGVPLIAELAKNLNKTEAEIKDMVSAGDIGFKEVEDAFTSMTSEGGKFFNLMDAQSKTLLGQISNIQDSFIKIARVMGEIFLPAAKFVAEHLAVLVAWFEEHPKIAVFAGVMLGVVTALTLIIGPLIVITALMPFLIGSFAALTAVTLPITGIILGIAAAIAGLILISSLLKNNWEAFIVGMKAIFTKFDIFMVNFLFGTQILWAKIWNGIVNIVLKAWNGIIQIIENSINGVVRGINSIISAINKIPGINIPLIPKVDLSRFKGELKNIDEIVRALEQERDLKIFALQKELALIRENAARLKAAKEITEEAGKQTKELTEQEKLVQKLAGFKLISETGDIFNPNSFKTAIPGKLFGEFESKFARDQAKLGGGVTINIENINGLDPDEIAIALNDKLKGMISI